MRALANQSVAELAKMHARLGRIEELKPLLEGVNKRRGRRIGPPDAWILGRGTSQNGEESQRVL